MGILSSIKKREETFKERLSLLEKKEPSWFLEQRRDAFKQFSKTGLPTRKDEEWKYLNLSPLSAADFGEGKTTQKVTLPDWPSLADTIIITIVNGKWDAKLSHNLKELPKEVVISNLSDAMGSRIDLKKNINHPVADSNSLLFLNTAFFDCGLFLSIPDKTAVKKASGFKIPVIINSPKATLNLSAIEKYIALGINGICVAQSSLEQVRDTISTAEIKLITS